MIESPEWYIKQIEKVCVITEGLDAGKPIKLLPWQKKVIRDMPDKLSIWVEIARKNGKSALLAAISIVHLLEGWKHNTNPQVIIAAATREQAGILFGYVRNMILFNPILSKYLIANKYKIELKGKAGFLKTIAADGGAAHGLNPSLVLCDEIHAWSETKGPPLYEALFTAGGVRMAPVITITTAGSQSTFAHEKHIYAANVKKKQIKDPYMGVHIYAANEGDNWEDPKTWKKANPSLGATLKKEYLKANHIKAVNDPVAAISFKKLHLNLWSGSANPFIALENWDPLKSKRPEDLNEWNCFLGIDLANVSDFNAFSLLWFKDGQYYSENHYLITRKEFDKRVNKFPDIAKKWAADGWIHFSSGEIVSNADRIAMIDKLMERWEISLLLFDPWNAHEIADHYQNQIGEEFVLAVPQDIKTLTEPMKLLYSKVLSKDFGHEGNPVTRWMVGNVQLVTDANENWKYSKKVSHEKIDGVAALVTAFAGYVHKMDDFISDYNDSDIIFI